VTGGGGRGGGGGGGGRGGRKGEGQSDELSWTTNVPNFKSPTDYRARRMMTAGGFMKARRAPSAEDLRAETRRRSDLMIAQLKDLNLSDGGQQSATVGWTRQNERQRKEYDSSIQKMTSELELAGISKGNMF